MASYDIWIRGVKAGVLSEEELYMDSPNYFTKLLEYPGFKNPYTQEFTLNKINPDLFYIISSYFYKEKILPLPETVAGKLSREVALSNLIDYAEYLELDGLSILLKEEVEKISKAQLVQQASSTGGSSTEASKSKGSKKLNHTIALNELRRNGWGEVIEYEDLINGSRQLEKFEGQSFLGAVNSNQVRLPVLIHMKDLHLTFEKEYAYTARLDEYISRPLSIYINNWKRVDPIQIKGQLSSCESLYTDIPGQRSIDINRTNFTPSEYSLLFCKEISGPRNGTEQIIPPYAKSNHSHKPPPRTFSTNHVLVSLYEDFTHKYELQPSNSTKPVVRTSNGPRMIFMKLEYAEKNQDEWQFLLPFLLKKDS